MTSRFPVMETMLAGLALGSVVTLWLIPSTPWLAVSLRLWALGLSGAWTFWCLARLDRTLARWRAWQVSPDWHTTPESLVRPDGLHLGQGFRWDATHVQALEGALREAGGLPAARGPRGGYPALHAVGAAVEEPVLLSWDLLRRHVGLLGTTGSGKSVELEAILAQLIRE